MNLAHVVGELVRYVDYRQDMAQVYESDDALTARLTARAVRQEATPRLYFLGRLLEGLKPVIRGGLEGAVVGAGVGAATGENVLLYAFTVGLLGVCIDTSQYLLRLGNWLFYGNNSRI